MAVYAAHLTRTLGGAPSVFQVSAADALASTVKPALRKLAEYISAVHPQKCGWLSDWYDELYLLLDCCLQYHYLKHYAASFAESFYGLVRVAPSSSTEFSTATGLSRQLERFSLLLLVLAPYIRDRTGALVDKWRERHEEGTLGKTRTAQLQLVAVRLHAAARSCYEAACLAQLCRYLSGGAGAHSPALALLGLTLKDALARHQEEDELTWGDVVKSVLTGNFGVAAVTFPMIGSALLRGAEYAAFGVQLARWWDAARPAQQAGLPTPPPPQRDDRAAKWKNRCPVCAQPWRTPTALPVSGYVFCYVCISRHVRSAGTCPVTNLPADARALVRLYVD